MLESASLWQKIHQSFDSLFKMAHAMDIYFMNTTCKYFVYECRITAIKKDGTEITNLESQSFFAPLLADLKYSEHCDIKKVAAVAMVNQDAIDYCKSHDKFNVGNVYHESFHAYFDFLVSENLVIFKEQKYRIWFVIMRLRQPELLTSKLIEEVRTLSNILQRHYYWENNLSNYSYGQSHVVQEFIQKITSSGILEITFQQPSNVITPLKSWQLFNIGNMLRIQENQPVFKAYDGKLVIVDLIYYKFNECKCVGEDQIQSVRIRGGILMDEPGLGKTLQALTYCYVNPTMTALILVPDHLVGQWNAEIQKHFGMDHLPNVTIQSVNSWDSKQATPDILIVDEIHEIYDPSRNKFAIWRQLITCPAKIKWGMTATPFVAEEMRPAFHAFLQFLSCQEFQWSAIANYPMLINQMKSVCFRTSKDNIREELDLPPISIDHKIMDFSDMEMNIYRAELQAGNQANIQFLRQLCNSIISSIEKSDVQNQNITPDDLYKIAKDRFEGLLRKELDILKEKQDRVENIKAQMLIRPEQQEQLQRNLEEIYLREVHRQEQIVESRRAALNRFEEAMSVMKRHIKKPDEVESTEDPSDDLCAICCMEYSTDGIMYFDKCGHYVCNPCGQRLIHGMVSTNCPHCREPHTLEQLRVVTHNSVYSMSTKMNELIKMLINKSAPYLIFTQFDGFLQQLRSSLERYQIRTMTVDQIQPGQKVFDCDAILLSSVSNASGLNLEMFHQVVILEPFESHSYGIEIEKQLIGRVHRMNQKHEVSVIRMVMRGTIEEDIYRMCITYIAQRE